MRVDVDGVDDPRLDDYRRLNEPTERRRVERAGDFFIAEGELVIRTLIGTQPRWPIKSVLVTPQRYEAMAGVLDGVASDGGVPVYVAPLETLRAVSGFDVHRGALASAERTPPRDAATVLGHAKTVLVLEAVSDHENLGALFRNVAALAPGGAILLGPRTGDPLYRRSLRVSMGHVLHVPYARIDDDLRGLDDAGYCVAALTPSPGAEPISSLRSNETTKKTALLLGAEGPGLTDEWLARAHRKVRIPMSEGVDSLNVAVAAAIALYELRRLEDVG